MMLPTAECFAGRSVYLKVWGSEECRLCRRINVTHPNEVAFASRLEATYVYVIKDGVRLEAFPH